MMNRLICAARAAWYASYEPARLWFERDWQIARTRWYEPINWRAGNPLVSVIIPTHNRVELLLDRALPSVRRQTYKNLEIIVAMHGCTDHTLDRIWCYDPRLRYLNVPRHLHYPDTPENHWFAGPVDPLNAALKVAKGAWVCRLDDDDTWTEDHVEALLRFAQEGDYEFVSSAHETDDGRIGPYHLPCLKTVKTTLVGGCQSWLYRSYLKFMRYNPDCWRKAWCCVNDIDLQDRMFKAGVRMGYLDQVTAYVLPRPGETHVGLKAYLDADERNKVA